MPLYDNPPHAVNTYTVASTQDTGGGTGLTYTLAQSSVPCSINTSGASERELFAQQGIVVTHRVAFLSSALTTPLARGMKLVATDNSASYHVRGISTGRAYGNVKAFTYADCEEQI